MIADVDPFARALDVELELVESAIRLVASGAASRVVVSNLAYGRVVLEPARQMAADAGVDVVAEPAADRARVSLVVTAGS